MAAVVPLAPHLAAWLAAHPYRSEAWLRAILADGFDVHHVDHDHSNNAPENLVLVERSDHVALHHGPILQRRTDRAQSRAARLTHEEMELGSRIYAAKRPGVSWKRAAHAAGMKLDRYQQAIGAKRLADAYAVASGLPMLVHAPVKDNSRLSPSM